MKDALKRLSGKKIGVFCAMTLLLTGCMGKDPVDSLHHSLEKAAESEKPFQEEQKTLEELETKENQLYDDVMKLNMDDYKKIVALSDDALENVSKREEHLKIENDSIKKSESEFEEAKTSAEHIKDKHIKEKADTAASHMEKRYTSYGSMYEEYKKALQLNKKLYKQLKDKDLTRDDLDQQIDKVNASYEKVLKYSGEFNEQTEKYNKARDDLYDAAGYHVKKS
ncbi:YkyA family protein [Bacillus cabrialesii]|uniref:YkyA family protein n=1 Tax=Bacillus cabrialesii subsp. tritici TaxID=2944916 RepID=A0ABT9DJE8_9BACI|nr:YkyA family protein [Bacillus cabrialesii]MDO8224814.1 YkyA family protein [Bacillus cabrialesii subsp. tritici]